MLCVKLKLYTVSNIKFRFEVSIEKCLNAISISLYYTRFPDPYSVSQTETS